MEKGKKSKNWNPNKPQASINKKIKKPNPHKSRSKPPIQTEQVDPVVVSKYKDIVKNPQSSESWLKLIAFHLDKHNIEEPRKQIEKALVVINFSSDEDKTNIWKAYMNLEKHYGNEKTFIEIYRRGIAACGVDEIISHAINLYKAQDNFEKCEAFVNDLLKKSKDKLNSRLAQIDLEINGNLLYKGPVWMLKKSKER